MGHRQVRQAGGNAYVASAAQTELLERRVPAHLCGEAHECIHQRDGKIAVQIVPVPLKLGMRLGDYMELQVPWLSIKQRLSLLKEHNLLQAVTTESFARLPKYMFAYHELLSRW